MEINRIPVNLRIKLSNGDLEQVENFKYLSINEQLNSEIEIKNQIESARLAFIRWNRKLSFSEIVITFKKIMSLSFIRSIFMSWKQL